MGNDYSINWKDHPEKGQILAAAFALTKSWRATSAIWGAQFPNDARGIRTDEKLVRRLQAQYGESRKGGSYWKVIALSPDTYRAPESSIGQVVMRTARTLKIQLIAVTADSNDADPDPGTNVPPSPPATPRSDSSHEATRTQPSQVEPPKTPRRPTRLSDRSTAATNAPLAPPTSLKRKRPEKADKSPMIDASRQDLTPFKPVSQREAHPDLECVMFRFYLPNGIGQNAPFVIGFKAGYFQLLNGVSSPAPESTNPMLFDFFQHHINRNLVPSPFVSMASRFFWTIRQAMKLFLRKMPNRSADAAVDYSGLRICLLDTATVQKHTSVFYAKPYHDQLKSRRVFTNGAWMYGTLHEHVAWHSIPKEAAICDFSVAELQELCAADDRLNNLLRLDTISEPGGTGKIHSALQEQALDAESVKALSRLIIFAFAHRPVGPVDLKRSPEYIKALVTGLVEGWKLRPRPHMPLEEWSALAEVFAHGIEEAVGGPLRGINRVRFVEAFLQGVRAGFRKWASEGTTALEKTCTRYGLHNVDAILDNVLTPPVNRFQHFALEENATPLARSSRVTESTSPDLLLTPITRSAARRRVEDESGSLTPLTRSTRRHIEDNVRVIIPVPPASVMKALRSSTTTRKRHMIEDESIPGTPSPKRRLITKHSMPEPPRQRRSPRNLPSRRLMDDDEYGMDVDEVEQSDEGDDDEEDLSETMADCIRVSHQYNNDNNNDEYEHHGDHDDDDDDYDDDVVMTRTRRRRHQTVYYNGHPAALRCTTPSSS
ncbi:hypothetical protein MBLNU457_g1052t1 [Dothideomycetes sp. NU457]